MEWFHPGAHPAGNPTGSAHPPGLSVAHTMMLPDLTGGTQLLTHFRRLLVSPRDKLPICVWKFPSQTASGSQGPQPCLPFTHRYADLNTLGRTGNGSLAYWPTCHPCFCSFSSTTESSVGHLGDWAKLRWDSGADSAPSLAWPSSPPTPLVLPPQPWLCNACIRGEARTKPPA